MSNSDAKITYKVDGCIIEPWGNFLAYRAEMEYNPTTKEHVVKEYHFMKPKEEETMKKFIGTGVALDVYLESPSPFTEPCSIEDYCRVHGGIHFLEWFEDMISIGADFEEAFKQHLPEIMEDLQSITGSRYSQACYSCEKRRNYGCDYCKGVELEKIYDDSAPYLFWFDKIEVTKIENIQEYIRNLKVAKELAEFMDTLLEYEGKPLGYEYCMRLILERMEDTFIDAIESCNTLFEVKDSLMFRWSMNDWVVMISETLYDKVKARGKGW